MMEKTAALSGAATYIRSRTRRTVHQLCYTRERESPWNSGDLPSERSNVVKVCRQSVS